MSEATLHIQYAVARDGCFLINQNAKEATPSITRILNWKP